MANTSDIVVFGRFQPQGSINGWDTAKARFLEGLDETDRALFKEANAENLFYSASNAERQCATESKVRSGFQKIQPLVNAIDDYGKALDTYANIASLYLAPIWGSIRVLLAVASKYNKFFSKMIDTLGRIGDILPRFRDYQRLFDGEKHYRFTQTVSSVYLDIIVFCTEFKAALRDQKMSTTRRIFQPLSPALNSRLEEAVARFRQHRKSVEKEADICHMIEEKEMRDLVKRNNEAAQAREREDKQKRLLEALAKVDYEYKHRRMQRIRHSGTGHWFTELLNFKEWRDSPSSALMCIYGIPGCGKSVLVSSLIDITSSEQSDKKTNISYFYCDYSDKRTLDLVHLFSSLAHQLLRSLGQLPTSVLSALEDVCQENKTVELDLLIDIINTALQKVSKAVIFVDGLDELSETDRKLAFSNFTSFAQLSNASVKVLVASREDLASLIQSPKFPVFSSRMGASSTATDIEGYVKHTVQDLIKKGELALGNAGLEEDIIVALTQGAKGMFLWVRFQLDDICNAITDNSIRKVLQNLPRDLAETYSRLLGRIDGSEMREHVKRIFNWIICAKRPLQIDELQEAIAFTIDDKYWDREKIPNDMNRLIRSCGNLVLIDEDTQDVRFAHYSVQQYLLDWNSPSQTVFNITREEADTSIGEVCVAYLSFSDFEKQVTQYRPNYAVQELKTVETAVRSGSILPSNSKAESIAKTLTRLRQRKTASSHVDFAQVLPTTKLRQQTICLEEKYILLSYVVEHWLYHTRAFPSLDRMGETVGIQSDRRILIFNHLVIDKVLSIDFRPWDKCLSQNDKFAYLLQIGWAISKNHIPLLRCLFKYDPDNLSRLLSTATKAYFETYEEDQEQNRGHWPDILSCDLGLVEEFPLEDNWAIWFYQKVIYAVRYGSEDSIITYLDYILQPQPYLLQSSVYPQEVLLPDNFLAHILLESVFYERPLVVEKVCAIIVLLTERCPSTAFNFWITTETQTEHGKVICNAADLAALSSSEEIMDIVVSAGCQVSEAFKNKVLSAPILRTVIENKDKRRFLCLMKIYEDKKRYPGHRIRSLSRVQGNFAISLVGIDQVLEEVLAGNSSTISFRHWIWLVDDPDRKIDILLALSENPSHESMKLLFWNAIAEGRQNRVELLIHKGCPIAGKKSNFSVPGVTGRRKAENFYETLLGYNTTPECLNTLRVISPLAWAILNRNLSVVASILEKVPLSRLEVPDIEDSGLSFIHLAIISGSFKIFSYLADRGARLDKKVYFDNGSFYDIVEFTNSWCMNKSARAQILIYLEWPGK